jgi:hypothetical protein
MCMEKFSVSLNQLLEWAKEYAWHNWASLLQHQQTPATHIFCKDDIVYIFDKHCMICTEANSSELHKCSELWISMMAFETVNIFSSLLCQLGTVCQLTERVRKFLPEVMAVIYACDGSGDVTSSYVLVKQQTVGTTLWKMLHEHTRCVKHHRTSKHWIIF